MLNKRFKALEAFSIGQCNIDCSYCYISKLKSMKNIHKDIIKRIENYEYFKDIKKVIEPNKLEYFSLWGTEPTLILHKFNEKLDYFFEQFPNVKELKFSTNFISFPDRILELAKKIPKNKSLSVQISLDGQKEITDENRNKGSYDKIIKNFIWLNEQFDKNEINCKIRINFKPTQTIDNLKWLLKENKVQEFYNTFDNLKQYQTKNKNISINYNVGLSLPVPSRYTKEDGIFFNEFLKYIKENYPERYKNDTYFIRYKRMMGLSKSLNNKAFMFTCSGGDSNFGLGSNDRISICHRLFLEEHDSYLNELVEHESTNQIFQYTNKEHINQVIEKTSANLNDEFDKTRFQFMMMGYHNFMSRKILNNMALIYELADCGQINKIYKNKEMSLLLATFTSNMISCPIESFIDTYSCQISYIGTIRLFGNGIFELLMENL